MTRIIGRTGSRRRSWSLFLAILSTVAMLGLVVVPAQAALDKSLFELDRDATDDTTTTLFGVLNAAIAAGGAGSTTIQVCQATSADATGFTLLIDAERFTVTATASAGGGGCANKRNLSVTRAGGSGHAKGENVSTLVEAAVDGDDWDVVKDALDNGDDTCLTLGAVECTFVHDDRSASIFTSSKDYDEIDDWQWRDQSVPDADELDDGFAVKYVDGDGDQHLFFGADRFATNGSKDAGFWFFHDSVGTVEPVGSADGTFTGLHTAPSPGDNGVFCFGSPDFPTGTSSPNCAPRDADDVGGDILILTTFTGGGAVTTVRVFEWIGPAGSDAALASRGTQGDCIAGNTTQVLCALVNNTTIESPWNYSGKGEPALNEISSGGFLEGGVNLTDLGLEGCFSSFMATTRSAPSLTADPKDFILGSFEACESTLTTTPADSAGTPLTDTDDPANGLVDIQIGAGAAGVDVTDSASIVVNGTDTWSGTLDFFLCGPITTGTCDTGGVPIDSQEVASTDTQPFVSASANLTSIGRYCWRGEFTSDDEQVPGDTDASTGECFEVKPVTPDLDTQAVDAAGADQTVPVPFGDPVFDKASLSGTANEPGDNGGFNGTYTSINATNGAEADGTITFELKGPDGDTPDCTTTATSDDATELNPQDVTVDSGGGDYFSAGFTPNLPGVYHWIASYSGSTSGNTTGTDHNTECDDTGEDVTVQQLQPTMDTEQTFIPNDSATISVAAGTGDLDGDLVFSLWVEDSTCAGTADQTFSGIGFEVFADDDGIADPLTDTVSTDNTTGYGLDADDVANGGDGDGVVEFYWQVEFTSNNGAHLGITGTCGNENSSITIDNGVTEPQST